MTKPPLTEKQQQTLAFLRRYQYEHGIGPTTSELRQALGLSSPCSVIRRLESLERLGIISRSGKYRGIEILVDPPPAFGLIYERLLVVATAARALLIAVDEDGDPDPDFMPLHAAVTALHELTMEAVPSPEPTKEVGAPC